MGKGDRRTRRGKITRGTHGVRRLRKVKEKGSETAARRGNPPAGK
jgi:ribosomal small subunit protein bTHX